MEKTIIAGFGGQGVLFVGKLLAYTGMVTGKHVSWIPSYGPEMRGGTANCSVIVSNKPVTSPIINTCTTLLAFNKPSLEKFIDQVDADGKVIYDGSLIQKEKPSASTFQWDAVPTAPLLKELKNPKLLNMIMLGAFLSSSSILSLEDLEQGMKEMMASKKPELIETNMEAIRLGYSWKDREKNYV